MKIYHSLFVALMLFSLMSCSKSENTADGGDDVSVTLSIDVSGVSDHSATLALTPSPEDARYIFGCLRKSFIQTGSSSEYKHYLDAEIQEMMSADGIPRAEAASAMSVEGMVTVTVDTLASETEYVCYAVGITDEGLYSTDVFVKEFTTVEEEDETANLSFVVDVSPSSTSVSVSVEPSDDTLPYYFDLMTAEEYDLCGGDVASYLSEAIDAAVTSQGLDKAAFVKSLQVRGAGSDVITGLPSDTDMVAYAVGLNDDGTCYGKAEAVPFHTLAPGNPEDCQFAFDILYTMSGVDITVTPSDDGIGYFTSVISLSEYVSDDALIERVYESIVQLAGNYGISLSQAVERTAIKGTDNWLYTDLEEGADYYVFAYALSSDGRAAGPVFKEQFTVTAYVSDVTVQVENVKWFNGDELADMDSQYEQIRGCAYFVADVVHSANAASWFIGLLPGDYRDSESYPDDSVYDAVMMGGMQDRERLAIVVNYGDLSVLGFAIDPDGVYGVIYREYFDITVEGASPVSEFNH